MPAPADIAQDPRLLKLTTSLGAGVLTPVSLSADEAIFQPYSVRVDAVSTNKAIDPQSVVGTPMSVRVQRKGYPARYFHGICSRFAAGGLVEGDRRLYAMEFVPSLWFLSETSDCRVFQNMTTQQILQALFGDTGVAPVQFKLYGDPLPEREYTVQFNETDLDFAHRLMEEEGLYYFFTHAEGSHTLVVCNGNAGFPEIPEGTVSLRADLNSREHLSSWRQRGRPASGEVVLRDYDFKAPSDTLEQQEVTTLTAAGKDKRKIFKWPGGYTKAGEGRRRSRIHMEAAEALAKLVEGEGQHDGFVPGGKFSLDSPQGTGTWVVQRVSHHATDESWRAGGGRADYANSFAAFKSDVPWRQPVVRTKPPMPGLLTAVVVGPSGEEIYTDDDGFGRVKVQFPWDREGQRNENSSLWIRVIQPWADKSFGAFFLPRIGSEVAVAFLDGDPDRPVVVGALYNGTNMPPFAQPAQKTKTGIKTKSSPGGGDDDFNELSFDDKAGDEKIYFRAQKDMLVEVKNDQTLKILNCRIKEVKVDETVKVDGKQAFTIKGDRTAEVTQGNDKLTVKTGNIDVKASMGNITTKAAMGKIGQEAMQAIELKVGSSSIKIDQMGVTIKGMMVKIEGTVQTSVKGLMTEVKGDGMLTLKGGITMIN